jgi:hypothetical protein
MAFDLERGKDLWVFSFRLSFMENGGKCEVITTPLKHNGYFPNWGYLQICVVKSSKAPIFHHRITAGRYLLTSIAAYVIFAWNFILNEDNGERYFLLLNACGVLLGGPLAWLVGDDNATLHGSAIIIFVFIGATVGSTMALARGDTPVSVASIGQTLKGSGPNRYRTLTIAMTSILYAIILSALYLGESGCVRVGSEYEPKLRGPTSWTGNLSGLLTGTAFTIAQMNILRYASAYLHFWPFGLAQRVRFLTIRMPHSHSHITATEKRASIGP